MKFYFGFSIVVLVALGILLPAMAHKPSEPAEAAGDFLQKTSGAGDGRYVVMIGSCNDCHTPGYIQAMGEVPESDWLEGDRTGWWGPWGTTYPPNLRILVPTLSEDGWVRFARNLKTKPPMPWWVLHEMKEPDLRAMYGFIHGLGRRGEAAPAALPPGAKPAAPYVQFVF